MVKACTATANFNVTAALAVVTFSAIIIAGSRAHGFVQHWINLVPHGLAWPLYILLIPIEIMGMLVRPFALTMRLAANMTGGHIAILAILSFVFIFTELFGRAIAPAGASSRTSSPSQLRSLTLTARSSPRADWQSTVAVNVACALAARGLRTGLLDADVYGPSGSMMLGIEGDLTFPNYFISNSVVSLLASPRSSVTEGLDYVGTLRGRVGYAANSWLFYATGGLAFAGERFVNTPALGNDDKIIHDRLFWAAANCADGWLQHTGPHVRSATRRRRAVLLAGRAYRTRDPTEVTPRLAP